jgi:hypothetical protein
VINPVLKHEIAPLTLAAKAGTTTHSDGEMLDVSANGGWGIGRGALVLTGEYRVRYETNRAAADPRDQIVPGDAQQSRGPAEHALGRLLRARQHALRELQSARERGRQADLLCVRRAQQPPRLARRLLPPRDPGAELAADLSARIPPAHSAAHRRHVVDGGRARRARELVL